MAQGAWHQGVAHGGKRSTFEAHAADLGRLVKRRELEWQEAMSPAAVEHAAKRLERARARHKTALDDVRRHADPADSSPHLEPSLTLAEASALAATFTAQCRMAAGNTGNRATARVLTDECGSAHCAARVRGRDHAASLDARVHVPRARPRPLERLHGRPDCGRRRGFLGGRMISRALCGLCGADWTDDGPTCECGAATRLEVTPSQRSQLERFAAYVALGIHPREAGRLVSGRSKIGVA
jgi:hypothetical protein